MIFTNYCHASCHITQVTAKGQNYFITGIWQHWVVIFGWAPQGRGASQFWILYQFFDTDNDKFYYDFPYLYSFNRNNTSIILITNGIRHLTEKLRIERWSVSVDKDKFWQKNQKCNAV